MLLSATAEHGNQRPTGKTFENKRGEMRKTVQVAQCAPIAVAAGDLGLFQVWNLETGELISEFHTVFDGCNRLAVSSDGATVLAANWRKGQKAGVACYEVTSGRMIWHRTDLRQVQQMRFSAQCDWVWCEVESRPVHCLDTKTGSTLKTLRTVRDALDSPYSPHMILLRDGDFAIETQNESISVPRLRHSGLMAAFSPDAVCVCEAFNPTIRPLATVQGIVRCIELNSGNERWRYQPLINHFIQLISYQNDHFFYCVQSESLPDGWNVSLVRLSLDSGKCTEVCRLSPPPYFGGFGSGVLVTPEGDVVSLQTGDFIKKLTFAD